MRRIFIGILFLFNLSLTYAQTYSIIDGRAIKFFKEAEELTLARQYHRAIKNYQDVINREGCFLDPVYGRVSNFWYWNEVRADGSLGPSECGYGW